MGSKGRQEWRVASLFRAQALLLSGVAVGGLEGKEQCRERLAAMVREEIQASSVNAVLMTAVNALLQGNA